MELNEKLIGSSIEKTLAPVLGFTSAAEVNEFLKELKIPLGDYTVLGTWLDDYKNSPNSSNLSAFRKDLLVFLQTDMKRFYGAFKEKIDESRVRDVTESVLKGSVNFSCMTESQKLNLFVQVPGLEESYQKAMEVAFRDLTEQAGPGKLWEQRSRLIGKFLESEMKKELSKAAKGQRDLNAMKLSANRAAFGRAGVMTDRKKEQSKTMARREVPQDKE